RELDKAQAEMIKQMWDGVGIRTKIETLERVAMNQRLGTGGTTGADFDVTTTRGGNSVGAEDSSCATTCGRRAASTKRASTARARAKTSTTRSTARPATIRRNARPATATSSVSSSRTRSTASCG